MRINSLYIIISCSLALFVSGCTTSKLETPTTTLPVLVAKPAVQKPVETVSSKPGKPFNSIIARHASENGVPIKLAHAVVFSESTYRANATGAAGEIGLMQLRLATARLVGYKGSVKGLYDPETNIKYGMKYLGKAHQLAGGTTCGTILRYNAGHGAKKMNPISQRYCNKVRKLL